MYVLDYKIYKYLHNIRDYLYEGFIDHLSQYSGINMTKNRKTKILQAVSCVVVNVSKALSFDNTTITVPLDRTLYARKLIFNGVDVKRKISYEYHRTLLSWLAVEGFIKLVVGGPESFKLNSTGSAWEIDRSTCSTITIKNKMAMLFEEVKDKSKLSTISNVVVLKGKDKEQKTYRRTEETSNMVDSMKGYNELSRKHKVTLINGAPFDVQGRRIFNNSSFDQGGRMFLVGDDNIQIIASDLREYILIDGEETVELDYSALHPSIIAEKEKEDLNGEDPYGIQLEGYNPKTLRKLSKIALIIMFNVQASSIKAGVNNASRALSREIASNEKLHPDKLFKAGLIPYETIETKKILEALYERNTYACDWFFSGEGISLQNTDAKIMSYIVDHFTQRGELILPIHDSALVRVSLKDELRTVMQKAYKHVLGSDVNCRIDEK